MLGMMQQGPLLISSVLRHAARHHGGTEVVSKEIEGNIHRTSWAEVERRSRRMARVLQGLGIEPSDRVGTLAWNSYRHLEIYYGAPGMGAICHTINPRLHPDDLAYIVNHAGDGVIFVDTTFLSLIAAVAPRITETVRAIVFMTDPAHMPALALPPGMQLLCYDTLMDDADESYEWPVFDENTASVLCYTSGTTGRPKGVLYSHRSTLLHAYAVSTADVLGVTAQDRMLPVVPMFHVNAWGTPYSSALTGTALIMPGKHLNGASLYQLMNEERVTMSAGVPTVWLSLLQYMRATPGARLNTVKRIMTGGSACPLMLIEAFGREFGVRMEHGWGMTEISPVGTYNRPKAAHASLDQAGEEQLTLKQGRALPGIDIKIVDPDNQELPWDGVAFGDLLVRGGWVIDAYYGDPPGSATDADGWFATGDVATIDPNGMMEIVDRSKDVIKSGGEWISSITLENIALSHPDVAEAAVIAARHPKWDERPLLIVLPVAGRCPSAESILSIYDGKIAKWWLPDAVVVVDELPHGATGKLQKMTLRAKYQDYLLQNPG